ncbi:carbohydrate porin [Acidisoma silvae]|uniref:Carbohydrate porin n=1 Tax=Acidisoma silvae TaxID=2802396 RepID=A0A963YSQ2_9PROT|nr:carbohydrate porin [Acidisoma silvae]MCB8876418.1 carbohydrate porin [Acidisoma silvae]
MKSLSWLILCGTAAAALLRAAPALAQAVAAAQPASVSLGSAWDDFLTRPTLTGNWGGLRTRLVHDGVTFNWSYVGEFAGNVAGGKRRGSDYAQQWTAATVFDLAKMSPTLTGKVTVTFNAREGRGSSPDFIGNKLGVQEVYGAGEDVRLSELSYERDLLNHLLSVKGGYYAMGNDFAGTPILCSFQNTGFCAHPISLPSNSGWSDYPTPKWGGRIRVNLPGGTAIETGIFEVNPTYADYGEGFKVSLSGSTGALIPVQIDQHFNLGTAGLPGHVMLGGYYDTSDATDPANASVTYHGRYGGYIEADQMVWRFQPGTGRGLIAILEGTKSDVRTATMPGYVIAALVAKGPLASRPNDFVGIGMVRAWANGNLIAKNEVAAQAESDADPDYALGEEVAELSYGVQVTPWLLLHPNLQYVVDPGAFTFKHTPNAWVLGMQTKITF